MSKITRSQAEIFLRLLESMADTTGVLISKPFTPEGAVPMVGAWRVSVVMNGCRGEAEGDNPAEALALAYADTHAKIAKGITDNIEAYRQ